MKLLLVAGRYPWPPLRGDQLRAVQYLEILGPHFDVKLLAPRPGADGESPPAPLEARLVTYEVSRWHRFLGAGRALVSGEPLQVGLFRQPALRRELERLAPQADVVVFLLARLAGHAPDVDRSRLLVDFIDALSLNMKRRAELDRPWLRPFLRLEAGRLERCERELMGRARASAVVCERDRRILGRLAPGPNARPSVVPLAMNAGEPRQDAARQASTPTVIMTGNLGYFVNRDAAAWWLREVWPELSGRRPSLRCVVAGKRPTRRLARKVRAAGAELVDSPTSLAPLLRQATVAVAPLRSGSGVPIKVLEAWAAGTPVVVSPWAGAGTTGVADRDFLVAERPGEWCDAVERLLGDAELRRRLAEAGRRRLHQDYGVDRVSAILRRWVREASTTI